MQFITFCLHGPIWEKRPVYFTKEAKFFARFVIIFPTLRFLRRNDNLVEKSNLSNPSHAVRYFSFSRLKKTGQAAFFAVEFQYTKILGGITMANYKSMFMRYMDVNGIKYVDRDEFVVKVTYSGDNLKSIPVFVFFDKDGDPMVQFKCWEIANFKGKEGQGIFACNEMNKEYRWVKFFLDEDADIIASVDAYIDYASCGEECMNLVRRVVNITDEAYPTFARALWA